MSETPKTAARKVLRSRIERQLKKQEEEERREMLRRRVEIAKEGVRLYAAGNLVDAVKRYQKYLLILEMWKKVSHDGLAPEHFDRKKDIYELILVSGIYWDLAKLYDKAKNSKQDKELTTCIQKFVMFSKGFPYQPLSAEALRRFLGSGKCNHRQEFRKAYLALTGDRCFVVTALSDQIDAETLPSLRRFRDQTLLRNAFGRSLVWIYYRVGPWLARSSDFLPGTLRRGLGRILDRIAGFVEPERLS